MKRKRIGYAKLGRSMQLRLEDCSALGGDNEMVPTLKLLAERHPDVDFVLVGRNSGEHPSEVGLPSNVINPWYLLRDILRKRIAAEGLNTSNFSIEQHQRVAAVIDSYTGPLINECDEIIMWLGQHGTTNQPIPTVKDRSQLTKPHDWSTLYGSYLIRGINRWRDESEGDHEEVLLNADSRNYVKYRDAKWPWIHPVIAQYNYTTNAKHERFGDDLNPEAYGFYGTADWCAPGMWSSKVQNIYARLEISSLLPGTPFGDTIQFNDDWSYRDSFGIVVNETRRDVNPGRARRTILKDWVVPLKPAFIHGTWSKKTLDEFSWDIQPIPQLKYLAKLQSVRSTFTTPASGSGWATAKPWEAFAAGVVCFFHPAYDDQNNILADAPQELQDFLRVKTPKELASRVSVVNQDADTFGWVIQLQREHFDRACRHMNYLHIMEARLGL